jgi:hypothetical protein
MSHLGLLTYYQGIKVCQDSSGITLCQSSYARKLLKKTGMVNCDISSTAMEARLQLLKKCSEGLVNATEYQSVVGALWYLVHTGSDLAHLASFISRFMAEPHEDHLAAVKNILRYVAGNQEHGVRYARGRAEDLTLLGFSDSDDARDVEDSRRTSGILFYLGQSPISWQSHNLQLLSTTERILNNILKNAIIVSYGYKWITHF